MGQAREGRWHTFAVAYKPHLPPLLRPCVPTYTLEAMLVGLRAFGANPIYELCLLMVNPIKPTMFINGQSNNKSSLFYLIDSGQIDYVRQK